MREFQPPPADVLRAFGATGTPIPVKGGQGKNFRAGNVILKPARDDEETNWIAAFYQATHQEGFQLPRPIRSIQGGFVSNGWQAWGGTRPWEAFLVQHGNNSRLTRLQTAGAKEKVLLKRTPLFSLLRRN